MSRPPQGTEGLNIHKVLHKRDPDRQHVVRGAKLSEMAEQDRQRVAGFTG